MGITRTSIWVATALAVTLTVGQVGPVAATAAHEPEQRTERHTFSDNSERPDIPTPADMAAQPHAIRYAGANRHETAAAIAVRASTTFERVYLARADNFIDALTGGTLSDGPVLLVPSCGELPRIVEAVIAEANPATVVALGGPNAICDELLTTAAAGRPSTRLAGPDRYSTAAAIAHYAFPDGADVAYVTGAATNPDALVAGTLTDGPILPLPSSGITPEVIADTINDLGVTTVVGLGGVNALPAAAVTDAADGRPADRLEGPDRYGTAAAIAARQFPDGAPIVYVTRSDVFADAVASAPISLGPVLLVPSCGPLPDVTVAAVTAAAATSVVALGGPNAVCDNVLDQVEGLLVEDTGDETLYAGATLPLSAADTGNITFETDDQWTLPDSLAGNVKPGSVLVSGDPTDAVSLRHTVLTVNGSTVTVRPASLNEAFARLRVNQTTHFGGADHSEAGPQRTAASTDDPFIDELTLDELYIEFGAPHPCEGLHVIVDLLEAPPFGGMTPDACEAVITASWGSGRAGVSLTADQDLSGSVRFDGTIDLVLYRNFLGQGSDLSRRLAETWGFPVEDWTWSESEEGNAAWISVNGDLELVAAITGSGHIGVGLSCAVGVPLPIFAGVASVQPTFGVGGSIDLEGGMMTHTKATVNGLGGFFDLDAIEAMNNRSAWEMLLRPPVVEGSISLDEGFPQMGFAASGSLAASVSAGITIGLAPAAIVRQVQRCEWESDVPLVWDVQVRAGISAALRGEAFSGVDGRFRDPANPPATGGPYTYGTSTALRVAANGDLAAVAPVFEVVYPAVDWTAAERVLETRLIAPVIQAAAADDEAGTVRVTWLPTNLADEYQVWLTSGGADCSVSHRTLAFVPHDEAASQYFRLVENLDPNDRICIVAVRDDEFYSPPSWPIIVGDSIAPTVPSLDLTSATTERVVASVDATDNSGAPVTFTVWVEPAGVACGATPSAGRLAQVGRFGAGTVTLNGEFPDGEPLNLCATAADDSGNTSDPAALSFTIEPDAVPTPTLDLIAADATTVEVGVDAPGDTTGALTFAVWVEPAGVTCGATPSGSHLAEAERSGAGTVALDGEFPMWATLSVCATATDSNDNTSETATHTFAIESSDPDVMGDRAALHALYTATDGPNWNIQVNWDTSTDHCATWYGVTCGPGDRVIEVYLNVNMGLSGSLPPDLGNLTDLRRLDLSWNGNLTGPLPAELGNLTQLEKLSISNSSLTGSLPPELGNLTQLQTLELSYNNLTGPLPAELGNLTQLEKLSISNNGLTGSLPPELGNLTGLGSLTLTNNNLTGSLPPELGNLTGLGSLRLGGNSLSGSLPAELGNLTHAQWLEFQGNNLSGVIPDEVRSVGSEVEGPATFSLADGVGAGNGCFTASPDTSAWLDEHAPNWDEDCV